MAKKEEYLMKIEDRYTGFTQRERDILWAGWAACETLVGLERLADSQS